MFQHKAVPVVIRNSKKSLELLLFRHPLAGDQIVKGSIEKKESYENAAIRELFEESGIENASVAYKLGQKNYICMNQTWHFFIMIPPVDLPNSWKHFAADDNGLDFDFFWQDINLPISTPWPEIFDDARLFILEQLHTIHPKSIS